MLWATREASLTHGPTEGWLRVIACARHEIHEGSWVTASSTLSILLLHVQLRLMFHLLSCCRLLLLLLKHQMRSAQTHLLLELHLWILALDLCVMIVHILLNGLDGRIAQLLVSLRVRLLNLLQVV